MGDARRQIYFMVFMSFAILVAGRVYRITRPPSPSEELEPLREELALFRAAADSCNADYAVMETAFLSYEAEVDSLRALIRRYESLDPQGVPGEQYPEYLEAFDAYNAAVPLWEGRSDSLRAQRLRCTSLTDQHNALADSARRRLIELGRWPSDSADALRAPADVAEDPAAQAGALSTPADDTLSTPVGDAVRTPADDPHDPTAEVGGTGS